MQQATATATVWQQVNVCFLIGQSLLKSVMLPSNRCYIARHIVRDSFIYFTLSMQLYRGELCAVWFKCVTGNVLHKLLETSIKCEPKWKISARASGLYRLGIDGTGACSCPCLEGGISIGIGVEVTDCINPAARAIQTIRFVLTVVLRISDRKESQLMATQMVSRREDWLPMIGIYQTDSHFDTL